MQYVVLGILTVALVVLSVRAWNERRERHSHGIFHRNKVLSEIAARADIKVPYAGEVGGLGLLIAIGAGLWEGRDAIVHYATEIYGPSVIFGVAPEKQFRQLGRHHLLHEFEFDGSAMAKQVHQESDLAALFGPGAPPPRAIERFVCKDGSSSDRWRLYEIPIIVANSGDKTAKNYQLVVTFSDPLSGDQDPEVRLVRIETDAFKIEYVDNQEPDLKFPGCIEPGIAPGVSASHPSAARSERVDGHSKRKTRGVKRKQDESKSDRDDDASETQQPDPMVRELYKRLKLTRDVVMLKSDLEAHEMQAALLVVRLPVKSRPFVILYRVSCENCRWFIKTTTHAQAVVAR